MKRCDVIIYSCKFKSRLFEIISSLFSRQLYTIHHVDVDELMKKSWISTTKYVIVESLDEEEKRKDDIKNIVRCIVRDKSYRMLMVSNWLSNLNIEIPITRLSDTVMQSGNADNSNLLLFNNLDDLHFKLELIKKYWQLNEEKLCLQKPTSIYLMGEEKQRNLFMDNVRFQLNKINSLYKYEDVEFAVNLNKKLHKCGGNEVLTSPNSNQQLSTEVSFSSYDYFSSLHTQKIGQLVLYGEVLESSFKLMENLVESKNVFPGLIIISRHQSKGKGRGENDWISPAGCAMFTLLFEVDRSSILTNYLSLLQHIVAVSIVEAVQDLCNIKNEVRIKWPNDVYWDGFGKLSGILSKMSFVNNAPIAILGCGINVSNNDPTVCLYDIINARQDSSLKIYPSVDSVIATVMNKFESNINKFQTDRQGLKQFKNTYYRFWMHQNQTVTYLKSGNLYSGNIVGIDDFGYLQLQTDSNEVVRIHPDGNSFDMMHNLIVPK